MVSSTQRLLCLVVLIVKISSYVEFRIDSIKGIPIKLRNQYLFLRYLSNYILEIFILLCLYKSKNCSNNFLIISIIILKFNLINN